MPQKLELYVSGGFTGIAGKWSIDADRAQNELAPEQLNALHRLINMAKQENVLGRDFTQSMRPANPASTNVADAQTYELMIDGQSAKWNDPMSAQAEAAPQVLIELRDWIRQNATREPTAPH